MAQSRPLNILLTVSGLIGVIIGGIMLFQPDLLYSSSGIELGSNPTIRNDFRAAGGAILGCGIVILMGVFISTLTFTAIIVSMVMYLSYGISRLYSFAVDGMPANSLVTAAALEIIIGITSIIAMMKYRRGT